VNKKHEFVRVFDMAGTPNGCADMVSRGSEPNEHGTWLYGRDGWCDGEPVAPWVQDITRQMDIRPGQTNSISYKGYYNGTDPRPTNNEAYLIMSSY
jgi:hypothetical protein